MIPDDARAPAHSLEGQRIELERINRLYSVLRLINQAIARIRSREELLTRICQILVDCGGLAMAWIGWPDRETQRLMPIARAGDEGGYLDRVEVYMDDRLEGRGSGGVAFREDRPYVCNDVLRDSAFLPWRPALERSGFVAVATFPIHASGVVCGTLNVYADRPDFFQDKEVALLGEAAADLSFALDNLTKEDARARAERIVKSYAAIVDSTDDAIVGKTIDGLITSWNPAAERIFGYGGEEIIGSPATLLIPPDRAAEEPMILGRIRRGERVKHFETMRMRKDGTIFPAAITASPIMGAPMAAGGLSVVGVSTIVRDISDLRRERAISETERRVVTALIESMPGLFYLYDANGQFVRWNSNFERLSGYGPHEISRMHPLDFFAADDKAFLARRIADVIDGKDANAEALFVSKDKSATPYFFSGRRIVLDGSPHVVGVGVDISKRKQAEDALRRSERAMRELNESLERKVAERTVDLDSARERAEASDRLKSAFLATMSHELRTPLNSILGFTGMVLNGMAGPLTAEQSKQLGMVLGSARHLLELIGDILDISKIEAGQLEVRHEEFDLKAAIERVASSVAPAAEKKGIVLRVGGPNALVTVKSDRRRLEQILINLLNNAIKFTQKGEIKLAVDEVKRPASSNDIEPCRTLRFRVSDTGIGIKADDLPKLFQPFVQIDSGVQRRHEGTGLGLAICRRLCTLLGGEVDVQSVWGEGSVFTVSLPLDLAEAT